MKIVFALLVAIVLVVGVTSLVIPRRGSDKLNSEIESKAIDEGIVTSKFSIKAR